jgi:hypothetical protein
MSRKKAVLKQRQITDKRDVRGLKLSLRAASPVMQWATNCHTNKNVVFVGHLREPIVVRGHYFAAETATALRTS